MTRADLISTILAILLFAGAALAQVNTGADRDRHLITPEDVLNIREVRELQLSPDGGFASNDSV